MLNKIYFIKSAETCVCNYLCIATLIICIHFLYSFLFLDAWFLIMIIPIYSHIPDNLPTPEVSIHLCSFKNIL